MSSAYSDFDPAFGGLYEKCRHATMTSPERMYALYKAVEYVTDAAIPGALAECGVWRGGSVMLMAFTLLARGCQDRDIFLYDTFEGMSAPTCFDVDIAGRSAERLLQAEGRAPESQIWSYATQEAVIQNLQATGYPMDRFHLIRGEVEQTIPATLPGGLALLRLDTDWYESTRHELQHLFPLLATRGVLIIDDYGHWQGARRAVDEYMAQSGTKMLLNRIDYTGRIGIKC